MAADAVVGLRRVYSEGHLLPCHASLDGTNPDAMIADAATSIKELYTEGYTYI